MAFHHDLRDEEFDGTYWWSGTGLTTEEEKFLAAISSLVHEGDPSIPYGFQVTGEVFDQSGNYTERPIGEGLTCATFVLAILRTYGFKPMDMNTWESRDEDAQWQQTILAALEENGAEQSHIEEIRRGGPSLRCRPEEVVGAASQNESDWSLGFHQVLGLAKEILHDMGLERDGG